MRFSRRGFIAGLLASAAVGPLAASSGFAELAAALPAGAADGWYDVFLVNDVGAETIVTVPRHVPHHVPHHERVQGIYLGTIVPDWATLMAAAKAA